jgi:hypothetical protein
VRLGNRLDVGHLVELEPGAADRDGWLADRRLARRAEDLPGPQPGIGLVHGPPALLARLLHALVDLLVVLREPPLVAMDKG